jgi:threonine aldolase
MREYPSSRIDFRSDTVTQPTGAMREAMHQAPVGDDVLGDDPTVLALQDRVAALFGKEAGLFVASGTMSNAIALRTHTVPGDEIICDKTAHIYRYEGGGYAALCGASIALVDGVSGLMTPEQVRSAVRKSEATIQTVPWCAWRTPQTSEEVHAMTKRRLTKLHALQKPSVVRRTSTALESSMPPLRPG